MSTMSRLLVTLTLTLNLFRGFRGFRVYPFVAWMLKRVQHDVVS